MKSTRYAVPSLLLALAMIAPLCIGCGGQPSNPCQVQGLVTYNDQPLPGANITFRKTDGSFSAAGSTNDEGVFTLQDTTGAAGAVPGEYTITVSKVDFGASGTVAEGDPNYGKPEAKAEATYLAPKKYSSHATTDLKATLVEGDNVVPLVLVD